MWLNQLKGLFKCGRITVVHRLTILIISLVSNKTFQLCSLETHGLLITYSLGIFALLINEILIGSLNKSWRSIFPCLFIALVAIFFPYMLFLSNRKAPYFLLTTQHKTKLCRSETNDTQDPSVCTTACFQRVSLLLRSWLASGSTQWSWIVLVVTAEVASVVKSHSFCQKTAFDVSSHNFSCLITRLFYLA